MVDWLGVNQGSMVHCMVDWGMMDWSMVDWSMMNWMVWPGVVDRSGVVDGSMTNTEVSLLSAARVTVPYALHARLVGGHGLLHHLHLHLQVVCGGQ